MAAPKPEERSRIYRAFVEKWGHPDYPPEPESEAEVAEIEERLGLALPGAYRQFLLEIGLVISTGDLLYSITEAGLDVRDMSEFYPARDVARATISWRRSNLPESFVTIASDGSGNQFCIEPPAEGGAADDAPIWLWRHETDTADRLADSFAAWIARFLEIERIPEP